MITLTIDGIEVTVERGATILDAARKAGVWIPTLCHDDRLIPYGACRMCVVELKGRPGRYMPACFNPAREGMEVLTKTAGVIEARKLQLQFLLRHHPLDCPVCEAGGSCELQRLVHEYEIQDLPFAREAPPFEPDNRSHFIKRDMNRCILCGSCVRICTEVQGVGELSFVNRGIRTVISPEFGRPLNCEFCGQCVSACPVGALANKPLGPLARSWEVDRTDTTCAFCGLGCALVLETKKGRITQVASRPEIGGNEGNLCVKGRYGWPYVHSDQRLTKPLVRKGDRLVEAGWEEAIGRIAETWRDIAEKSGPPAVAVLGSARVTNEEAYALQRLARGVIGTPHLDHGAGLSYRPLTEGVMPVLGHAAATNGIREIREAQVILAVGADFKMTHPVAKNQVVLATGRNRARLFVLDHVHTSFCDIMGAESLMVRPGMEGLALRAMIRVLLDEELWDRAYVEERTEGLEAVRQSVTELDIQDAADRCGLDVDQIRRAVRTFAGAERACILMGLDMLSTGDPVDAARCAASLALLSGKIGREGCGLHIYAAKANSQGALDMGLTPAGLPGHRSLAVQADRELFEARWACPLPEGGGWDAATILEGCIKGRIRSLYVVGENPEGGYPDRDRVAEALEKTEFLVVQDLFLTDTAKRADVVLPAAAFAEKQGTFTSVERRIQRVQPALAPPGEALADLEIFSRIAEAMGKPFPWTSPADVLEEIGETVPVYGGIRWEIIPEQGLVWPLGGDGQPRSTPRLYEEGFPGGKARMEIGPWKEIRPKGDRKTYPFFLHPQAIWFHSGTFSTWSASLMEVSPGPTLIIHREDARALGLERGDTARVASPRGSVEASVQLRPRGPRGVVQVTHHFSGQPLNRLLGWGDRLVRVRVEKA